MNLGWTEILLIGGIALLLFGPSRLPGLGKSLGEAIRGFKKGLNEDEAEVSKNLPHDPVSKINNVSSGSASDPLSEAEKSKQTQS